MTMIAGMVCGTNEVRCAVTGIALVMVVEDTAAFRHPPTSSDVALACGLAWEGAAVVA